MDPTTPIGKSYRNPTCCARAVRLPVALADQDRRGEEDIGGRSTLTAIRRIRSNSLVKAVW
jgi:hypothetical protein